MEIKERLDSFKADYNKRLGKKLKLEEDYNLTFADKTKSEEDLNELNKIQILLESTSNNLRKVAIENVEKIVTNALQYIYEEDVKFKIDLDKSRGKPSCEFYIEMMINGEISRQRPEDAVGGGYVDTIAAALRYAYISAFTDPKINNVIALDEPGKMVSEQASVNFSKFIKELGKMFDKQTIVITHNENIMNIADKSYTVLKQNEKSVVMEGGFINNEDPF